MLYLAPEMLERKGHTFTLDWYLLGVLTYELLDGFYIIIIIINIIIIIIIIIKLDILHFMIRILSNCLIILKREIYSFRKVYRMIV